MGHNQVETTQGNGEGGSAPLAPRATSKSPWLAIARKIAAITLGGIGLAAIGALSMAPPGNPLTSAPSAAPALANVLPTEWLAQAPTAPGPAIAPTSEPTVVASSATTLTTPSAPCPSPSSGSSTNSALGRLPDGRVVLNLATESDLTTLPGVGQKRAQSILALRAKLKGFRKLSDLLRIKGIGIKSLKKLEPKLVLDRPNEPS